MEEQVASRERTHLDYDVAIYLLNRLPLERAISLLENRLQYLAEQAEEVQASLAREGDARGASLKLTILDHNRRFLEMEQGWLAEVVAEIEGGGADRDTHVGDPRGLMILSGDLRNYHLPDLIRLIVSGRHGGTLTVTDGSEVRTVSFENGEPVCGSCVRRGERPTPPSLDQVLEGLSDLFRWQEGTFTFDQEMGCEEWCVPLTSSAEDLILSGCRRVDNWAVIQRLVPSAATIFQHGAPPDRVEHLTLTANEQQIASAVDGVRDVAAIARELGLTLFEASRVCYCLAAVGIVRSADPDKIRLRRVFREIAELMCSSTIAWRSSPDDRTCEEDVNSMTLSVPLRLDRGRIEDQSDPRLKTEELVEMYRAFLLAQLDVISRRFGQDNAQQSFELTLRQLAPELQNVAKRYRFDRLLSA
jgi:hypothetical protein